MAEENGNAQAQKKAQKDHADRLKAQEDEKLQRKLRSESGPVSVAEATQANPNPPKQKRDTPRPKAQKDAGMDENTLQEDVGLKNEHGIQPQKAEEAGDVKNAAAISTQQHTIPPQGTAEDESVKDKKNA